MAEMEERHTPPVESLAGYHPDARKAYLDADRDETTRQPIGAPVQARVETPSRGAQSFVLKEKQDIERVELCVSSAPDVREPLRASLRRDRDGLPEGEAVNADAIAVFDPWETPEGLSPGSMTGYYRFTFAKSPTLESGVYWIVFEMDPARQPRRQSQEHLSGAPGPWSCYGILLASSARELYPAGRYLAWETEGWKEVTKHGQALGAFFGVFAADR